MRQYRRVIQDNANMISDRPVLNPFDSAETLDIRALFLGQRIDLQLLNSGSKLAADPLSVTAGEQGCAVLFDYGVAVLIGLSPVEEARFLNDLNPLVEAAFSNPETEAETLKLDAENPGKAIKGAILLSDFSLPQLQILADVLAKSVVLAYYEVQTAAVFDRIEPFAASLRNTSGRRLKGDALLKQIGDNLLIQHKMVGRVEIIDKPEMLWEHPELDRLYLRLEDEYEIRERHTALERKLALVSLTAETALELQHQNTSLRLEWYVVILIVIEVLLSLYELFIQ
ncbi:MAG: RMD1 family protein [Cyanobacteria bacterium P01_C01_bin.73]